MYWNHKDTILEVCILKYCDSCKNHAFNQMNQKVIVIENIIFGINSKITFLIYTFNIYKNIAKQKCKVKTT